MRKVDDKIGTWRKSSCLLPGTPPKTCRDEQRESRCTREPADPVRPSPNGGNSPAWPQNRCDEAIALLRDSLDVGRPIRIVSKRLAQLDDHLRERILAYDDAWPYLRKQRFSTDHLARPVREVEKDGHGLGLDLHCPALRG